MNIADNLRLVQEDIPKGVKLVAVSKTKPNELILEAYKAGQRCFGENKPQELSRKHQELNKDIEWHMIGHLQTNKVKYIAPFVALIHAVDSLKLLKQIDKEAAKHHRCIDFLFQVHIAQEESKFGFNAEELVALIDSEEFKTLEHVNPVGLMGMATFTEDEDQVRAEFKSLTKLFQRLKENQFSTHPHFKEISMGMSGDFKIAIEEGSTMVRVGSSIFGARNYAGISG